MLCPTGSRLGGSGGGFLDEELDVVGDTSDPAEAVRVVGERRPRYLLIDAAVGHPTAERSIRGALRAHGGVQAIVLSESDDPRRLRRTFEAGAAACVLSTAEPEALAVALRIALSRIGKRSAAPVRAHGAPGRRRPRPRPRPLSRSEDVASTT